MFGYRDTLTYPKDTSVETVEAIEEWIRGYGFIHGHKSANSVEFELDELLDQWDACERAYEFSGVCASYGVPYVPDKELAYEVLAGTAPVTWQPEVDLERPGE